MDLSYDKRILALAAIAGTVSPLNALFWIISPGNLFLCGTVWAIVFGLFLVILQTGKKSLIISCFFLLISVLTLQTVLIDWDARAIWLFHAKFIYFKNDFFGSLDPYDGAHPTYPVIYSAMVATLAKLVGHWNDVYPNFSILPFFFAPLLVFSLLFKGVFSQAFMCIAVVLTCKINLFNGYMDGLVGLHTTAILFLYLRCRSVDFNSLSFFEKNLTTFLFFVLGVTLLNLKNEGSAALLVIISIIAIQAPSNLKRNALLSLITSFLAYLFMWKYPVFQYGLKTDIFTGPFTERLIDRLNIDSILAIISHLLHDIWKWLALIFVIKTFSRSYPFLFSRYKFVFQFCIIYFAILFCIYLGTPADLIWHLKTSAGRVSTPIAMGLAMCITHWFCHNPYIQIRSRNAY